MVALTNLTVLSDADYTEQKFDKSKVDTIFTSHKN